MITENNIRRNEIIIRLFLLLSCWKFMRQFLTSISFSEFLNTYVIISYQLLYAQRAACGWIFQMWHRYALFGLWWGDVLMMGIMTSYDYDKAVTFCPLYPNIFSKNKKILFGPANPQIHKTNLTAPQQPPRESISSHLCDLLCQSCLRMTHAE